MKMQQIIESDYIKGNADIFLISTKDGYLHALNKDKKLIWKLYLEQELMSSLLSPRKLGKDFYLYPINEQIYIYKDGEFISFNIFVKDLVERHLTTLSDFTLTGKTKTTLYIIDMDTGEIIQKIDDESNFSYKKSYYISKNKKTITLARVDYILNCLGLGEGQKFWNASYSDIIIQKGNENLPDNIKIMPPNLNEILNEYNMNNIDDNDNISKDNVITAYCYFNENLPPIKIYDRSNSHIGGELKYLTYYNNLNKLGYIDNNQMIENINNNNDLLGLPNDFQNNENNINNYYYENINENNKIYEKNNSLFKKFMKNIKNNWYLYVIIMLLLCELSYYKLPNLKALYVHDNKDKNISLENDNKHTSKCNKENKDIIINENKIDENMNIEDVFKTKNKTVLLKHKNNLENIHIKKYSYDVTIKRKRKKNKDNIKQNDITSKEKESKDLPRENNKEITNNIDNEIKNKNSIKKQENKSKENSLKINSNDNCSTNKGSNGIWDDDDEEEEEEDKKNIESEENKEEESKEEESKEEESKEEENNISSNKTKTLNKSIKSSNGIWDDDDEDEKDEEKDEEEKEEEHTNETNNKTSTIKKNIKNYSNNDLSYEQRETNENTNQKVTEEIKNEKQTKKEKRLSRLDTDFDNLEKVGEGGFGIVLKGKHKIDKDTYAIKIIDLSYNSKERDEIISEAKKMNSIKGEYIVNYSICWYDDNLGSAEKFFEKSDISYSLKSDSILSKSISFNITKKGQKTIFHKFEDDDIFDIKEVNEEDNCDENNICFNKENSNSKYKFKNNNNSLEFVEENSNQIYNNRSKYCFDYMDDSKLLNNSILSKKYNEEIYSKKDKKYFFILMEYCDGLTLENYISEHSNKTIERKIIYTYTKQILKGLKKLHKYGIIHRDIKPGNIFIKNEQIKIGDFGLATKFKKNTVLQTKDLKGFTPSYAAPEQTKSKTYNEKVDIYATGITLFEMCSCFGTEMERQLALRDLRIKRIVSERVNKDYPEETKLIIMMTKEDYNDRPSAEQILKSDLFVELGKIVNN